MRAESNSGGSIATLATEPLTPEKPSPQPLSLCPSASGRGALVPRVMAAIQTSIFAPVRQGEGERAEATAKSLKSRNDTSFSPCALVRITPRG